MKLPKIPYPKANIIFNRNSPQLTQIQRRNSADLKTIPFKATLGKVDPANSEIFIINCIALQNMFYLVSVKLYRKIIRI